MLPSARTSLDQWAILAAVIDHGGFAQAAAALHKSQSSVSYALARLQEALDLPLLTIEGRKAVLTEHGRILLGRARPLLRDLHALETLARRLKQGWEPELSLVVDVAFPREYLLGVITELQRLCPSTRIQIADAVLSEAEEAITGEQVDVVVTTRVPEGFLGDLLLSVDFVAIAAPTHPLFDVAEPLTVAHLESHTQIVIRDSGSTHRRDDGWLTSSRRFTVSGFEASRAMIRAGLGYAWLPMHIVQEDLHSGTLRILPLAIGGTRAVSLYLVVAKPDHMGPAARHAVACFRSHVHKAGLAGQATQE